MLLDFDGFWQECFVEGWQLKDSIPRASDSSLLTVLCTLMMHNCLYVCMSELSPGHRDYLSFGKRSTVCTIQDQTGKNPQPSDMHAVGIQYWAIFVFIDFAR